MAYGHYRSITIDHTKVPNTDQSNFAVLVAGTYTDLRTVANGGRVTDANGYDVAFFSDSNLTTQLKHETELWIAASGLVVYSVKIPTVSKTTDTVFYMAYGNAAISTDQSDKNNVWDASYKGVWHLGDGTTLSGADSTVNGKTITFTGTPTAAAMAGKVDGGAQVATTNQYNSIYGVTASLLGLSSDRTIEAWMLIVGAHVTDTDPADFFGSTSQTARGQGEKHFVGVTIPSNTNTVKAALNNDDTPSLTSASTLTTGVWYHVAAVFTGTVLKLYVNGALINSVNRTVTINDGYMVVQGITFGYAHNANIDEIRASSGERSADWIATEYNNQNDPSTFYTVGAEQATTLVLSPTTGSLALTAATPVVSQTLYCAPSAGVLNLTAATPVVSQITILSPTVASLGITPATPVVTRFFLPTTATLSISPATPTITQTYVFSPTTAICILTPATPAVGQVTFFLPSMGSLAFSMGKPTVETIDVSAARSGMAGDRSHFKAGSPRLWRSGRGHW